MLRKSSISRDKWWDGQHRFEHWYRDNTIYFITARCRGRYPAFRTDEAKRIFWKRFDHYAPEYGFVPIIRSLLDNHYHALGYLKRGANLGPMMRLIHGSASKLVNDVLQRHGEPRLRPFWYDTGKQGYFDGCIRDEIQCRRAFRYTLTQCSRHGVCADPRDYPHTKVGVDIDRAVRRAHQLRAFMEGVEYARYAPARRARYGD